MPPDPVRHIKEIHKRIRLFAEAKWLLFNLLSNQPDMRRCTFEIPNRVKVSATSKKRCTADTKYVKSPGYYKAQRRSSSHLLASSFQRGSLLPKVLFRLVLKLQILARVQCNSLHTAQHITSSMGIPGQHPLLEKTPPTELLCDIQMAHLSQFLGLTGHSLL